MPSKTTFFDDSNTNRNDEDEHTTMLREAEEANAKAENFQSKAPPKRFRIRSKLVREFIAETLGVFLLVTIGNGSVAQSILSNGGAGGMLSINLAYGLGVTIAIYFTGTTSGAHLNPAVTIALAAFKKFSWKKVAHYIIAQMLGAFLSGVAVYVIYFDAIHNFDGGLRAVKGENATAMIFTTFPQHFLSIRNGVFDQIFGTFLLVATIFAVNDKKNNKLADGLTPLIIGLLVVVIGMAFGFNCGYAINPARDLGPRLFTAMAGWGFAVFSEPNGFYWFFVPVLSPIIGALIGAFAYESLIGYHIVSPSNNNAIELSEVLTNNSSDTTGSDPVITSRTILTA